MTGPSQRLDRGAVLVEAGRLAAEGRPFVLATVASVRRPASARIGDRGIVTADGRLVGWVGGACSEPAVVREALRALAEGTTRRFASARREAPKEGRVSSWPRARARRRGWSRC